MANFKPFNNYALYILGKLIDEYNLKPPFLDIACGTGYLSEYLGKKGWQGKAIDLSEQAINITKNKLKSYKKISVEKKAAEKEKGRYQTVFMFDLLEHIKNDQLFLKKVYSLVYPNGHLVIAVPSNPKEWRWDDEFYGHYRRYTAEGLMEKLNKTGFKSITFYDYTFPFFWFLRRIYTTLKKEETKKLNMVKQTEKSSIVFAWNIPLVSMLLNNITFIWYPIYLIQYIFFRNKTDLGSAILILAQKRAK